MENQFNLSFEKLSHNFMYYFLEVQDGKTIARMKDTSACISDFEFVAQVEYAYAWFNEITKSASRTIISGNLRQDERLVNITFGDIGKETFVKIQKSFTEAYLKVQNGKSDGKDTGANLVANLQNVKKHSSYENDVIKTLCASSDEIESENFQGRHPEIFQAQTMEFMASDYLNEAKGGHHFQTVEKAVNKANGSIASALGLPDAPALAGEQAMSR